MPVARKRASSDDRRDIIVAIDAGHGGEDPGAIGKGRTREKDVVLQISRRLEEKINAERGMRAVMVRTGDYYVDHRRRMAIAHQHNADLFVSIHADAVDDRRANGATVYALSLKGASDEEARLLAERGVRYIQLFDWGWDSHGTNDQTDLRKGFVDKCRQIDQPVAAQHVDPQVHAMSLGRPPLPDPAGVHTQGVRESD